MTTRAPSKLTLSQVYRPTRDEILTYAELIAAAEGMTAECAIAYQREAELQLWAWRSETHQRPLRRRASRQAA